MNKPGLHPERGQPGNKPIVYNVRGDAWRFFQARVSIGIRSRGHCSDLSCFPKQANARLCLAVKKPPTCTTHTRPCVAMNGPAYRKHAINMKTLCKQYASNVHKMCTQYARNTHDMYIHGAYSDRMHMIYRQNHRSQPRPTSTRTRSFPSPPQAQTMTSFSSPMARSPEGGWEPPLSTYTRQQVLLSDPISFPFPATCPYSMRNCTLLAAHSNMLLAAHANMLLGVRPPPRTPRR